ncbi:MAG: tyrosine-type recombinase/integrase [Aeriscardovia sp.]|nr:tyrosine-type recombinase/integrase [Aeriscardovia sp.]
MARRGENIYKRKDGRWEGRYKCGYCDNKAKYRSMYAHTYQEVKEKLQKLKANAVNYVSSGKRTVGELCCEWLAAVKLKVKQSTYACYQLKVNKHILPTFGGLVYDNLTVSDIHEFISNKLKRGLSAKYVCDIIVVMKSMAKYISRVHNYKNPLENVIMPKKEKHEMKLLSQIEQKRLCKFILTNPNKTKLAVILSYYAGLRIGEVCGLKWCDIDFSNGILRIERTIQRVYENGCTRLIIGTPKSISSVREIPLPEFITDILRNNKGEGATFVLSGTDKPLEPRTLQYRFKALLNKLNLSSVNYHSLRHMFATNCIELGFDVKTLSELLGHSSVETTLNRYVHSSMERKTACMNLLHAS